MNKLLEAFNVNENRKIVYNKDYSIFKDKELLSKMRIGILNNISNKGFTNNEITKELIESEIDEITYGYDLSNEERTYLFNLIDSEINGYGPIDELLKDDNITEIMVNDYNNVYIEIEDQIVKDESISFINDEHVIRTIERLISSSSSKINASSPILDATLKEGYRLTAMIPPIVKNPLFTIHKFKKNIDSIDSLICNGSLTPNMATFLECAIKAHLNILVTGTSSGGKTTLVNILGNLIPNNERIITIEDIFELNINKEHLISLETKINTGSVDISIADLLNTAIRMHPNRIIVGEIKGAEANNLLQIMNSSKGGIITSIYANSSKDALSKLETMVLMDSYNNLTNVREYIAHSLDLVIHIERLRDGKRKITNISAITGLQNNEIVLEDIFSFKDKGLLNNGEVNGEYIENLDNKEIFTKIKKQGIDEIDNIIKKKVVKKNPKKNNKSKGAKK